MENLAWAWGLSLIAVAMALHATAVVIMTFMAIRIRVRLENRDHALWKLIAVLICMIAVVGLLLAVLHAMECGIWAAAYWWLGALDSFLEALLYSVDSMSTRGATRLVLERRWQMMGALEAVDGMLLFGVSAAYIFAVMQTYWQVLAAQATSERG
jgi:hypothetical protein